MKWEAWEKGCESEWSKKEDMRAKGGNVGVDCEGGVCRGLTWGEGHGASVGMWYRIDRCGGGDGKDDVCWCERGQEQVWESAGAGTGCVWETRGGDGHTRHKSFSRLDTSSKNTHTIPVFTVPRDLG